MAKPQQLLLKDIADYLNAELLGDGNSSISGINTLQDAEAGQIAFLSNPKYQQYLSDTQASAVILKRSDLSAMASYALIVDDPYLSYAKLTALFTSTGSKSPTDQRSGSIHSSAVVANSADIHPSAVVEPNSTVAEDVVIGEGSIIGAGSYIGTGSTIGKYCHIYPNVTLYHGVTLGDNVIVHSGAVIGADGFGFAHDGKSWVKIHQLGGVEIGDAVEVGACTTIDRGAIGNTVIGSGVILDNHVQIAHNVVVGRNSAMASQTGIAGSTDIGENCTFSGRAGAVGHIAICAGVHVTAGTIITKSISSSGSYSSGTGTSSSAEWRKNAARFNKLDDMAKRITALEKKLKK